MTVFLLDVASYQGSLAIADVIRAGFTGVNLKTSHGLGQKSVHPDVAGWAERAKAAGMVICSFHYLDSSATGAAQAGYAFDRLAALGLVDGCAHQVDCESTATLPIVREYVITMQAMLGRPVVLYTGDWWWEPHGWNISDLTGHLWSAPNAGYLSSYPGDTSAHWAAGYGGWPSLSIMQYSVAPLTFPDGTHGSIEVSKSAVRDPTVLPALTGGGTMADWVLVPCLIALRAEFNLLAPDRDKSSDGSIGDAAHAGSVSDHNPDETGNTGGVEDADSINEVHAIDVDMTGPWPAGLTMERIVQFLVGRCKAGLENRFRYIIYNRRIWSASTQWEQRAYTGSNPHDKHAHFSAVYGSGASSPEQSTASYGLKGLITDMPLDATDKKFITDTVNALIKVVAQSGDASWKTTPIGQAVLDNQSIPNPITGGKTSLWVLLRDAFAGQVAGQAADAARDTALSVAVTGLQSLIQQLLDMVSAGGGDLDTGAVLAKLDLVQAEISSSAEAAGRTASEAVLETMRRGARAEADALGPPA